MPQIREYTAENDVLRPTETGIEATAQAARRIGAFYSQAGETEKRSAEDLARAAEARARAAGALATEEKAKFSAYGEGVKAVGSAVEMAENYAGHQEIGHAAANMAQATQQLTQQWNGTFDTQAKTDPNNTSIQTGYMQGTFEPWAQKFVAGFNTPLGQDWANEQVNHLRNHLFAKTTADMSLMAELAVKSNWDKTVTSMANTARADPSTVDFMIGKNGKPGQIDRIADALIATSPNLKGVDAAKFRIQAVDEAKRSFVHAGALGAIEQSSDQDAAAKDYTQRYSNWLDPTDTDNITKAARTYRRAQEMDADRADRKLKDAADDASSQKLDSYIKDIWSAGKTTLKDILKDPQLTRQDRERAIAVFQKEDRLSPNESHNNMFNILDDIRTGKITKDGEVLDQIRMVNREDLNFLRNELANHNTPQGKQEDFFKKQLTDSVKSRLQKFQDPRGSDAMYRWQFELENRMHQPGKDPMRVFNPADPDYMGSANALKPFMSPLQQRISGAGGVGSPLPATFKDRFQAAGPEAPPARFYNGSWYTRGPNGESVKVQ